MEVGARVQIRPSFELIGLKLMPLSFRKGKITEIHTDASGEVLGAWVELDGEPYLDELEWYIPINSLKYEQD